MTLSQTAVLAQHIDVSCGVLDKDNFRYKAWDCLNKSNLQIFKNEDLIYQDDVWNMWHWTEEAQTAITAVRRSPITEASETQLEHFRAYSETLSALPLGDTFLTSEYDGLVGARIGNLRHSGIIEEAGTAGKVSIWQLTDFAKRVINSVAAQENDTQNFNRVAAQADD